MKYIDFHTHIFPDSLAPKTIPYLEEKGNVQAKLDGTLADLKRSMDEADIEKSVVCLIATKPNQFSSILDWSKKIRSGRIIPFPSFHPDDPECLSRVCQIKEAGFLGIKLHPYYQNFILDEEKMLPLYERITTEKLVLVMHTGFDIGFPREQIASPRHIINVVDQFPDLKLVTTHCGAWDQWPEARERLLGRPLYMDISFSLDFMTKSEAKSFLSNHLPEYLLFGSDSPWAGQKDCISAVKELGLEEELESLMLRENALRLLGLE